MARPKSKKPWTGNEVEILGGKSLIFTTRNSGGNFYIRMKIPSEGKYLKQSLKTRDLETAVERAEEITVKTLADVKVGRKVFGITLGELVRNYLDYRRDDIYIPSNDVEMTGITEGRFKTIKTQLNNFLRFKDKNLKLSELDDMACYEYFKFRKTEKSDITISTVRNEQATINNMMKFAFREGYNPAFEKFRFREISVKGMDRDSRRRDTFEHHEYQKLVRSMRRWVREGEKKDEKTSYERSLIQLCILIGANTMLRVGELWNLVWKDVRGIRKAINDRGAETLLVDLRVRKETSKVRKDRDVLGRGGEYFRRLKKLSNFTGKDDYVFSDYQVNQRFSRDQFYRLWEELMIYSGFDSFSERKLTWYSLRHFGITQRLRAEVEIGALADICGTSVAQIEKHYGHFDQKMKERAMTKVAKSLPPLIDVDMEEI